MIWFFPELNESISDLENFSQGILKDDQAYSLLQSTVYNISIFSSLLLACELVLLGADSERVMVVLVSEVTEEVTSGETHFSTFCSKINTSDLTKGKTSSSTGVPLDSRSSLSPLISSFEHAERRKVEFYKIARKIVMNGNQ